MIAIGEDGSELGSAPTTRSVRKTYIAPSDANRRIDELMKGPEFVEKYNNRDSEAIAHLDSVNRATAQNKI
ncbi:MAG: hypothetical protein EU981_02200 [Candidatus Liberibacter ctenarytainae]|uniref:Uncharacterized protein n=1 Tax=Candidatus Liberibacter ctenarytainae TaxID=2020335 RepID=A0A937ACB8_9HYPH|nr:hypothetical protein [Candidatus Liberibacter ctenarytainae]